MMMDTLPIGWQHKLMLFKFINDIRIFLVVSLLLFAAFHSDITAQKYTFEAESAKPVGSAFKVAESAASGGFLVSLTESGDGIEFTGLPSADKLAIRYASLGVGLISVTVNNQPVQKLNVHSSGNLTGSFLYAIIDMAIPADAMLTISLVTNDITVNIDQIIVGDGDLGLPPDIWNLPPLPVAAGPVSRRLEGIEPALHRAGVVARCQVWRMGALGSAIHARAGRLVCTRHVYSGQRTI